MTWADYERKPVKLLLIGDSQETWACKLRMSEAYSHSIVLSTQNQVTEYGHQSWWRPPRVMLKMGWPTSVVLDMHLQQFISTMRTLLGSPNINPHPIQHPDKHGANIRSDL